MLEAILDDKQTDALIKVIGTVIVSPHVSIITPILYVTPEQYDRLQKLGIVPPDEEIKNGTIKTE